MTCEEIVKKLRTLKIPVAYSHFNKAPAIPFCVYTIPESSFYGADNKNMLKNRTIHIELYTDHKDETLENKVAALFNDHEIDVYEDYIEDQKLYQVVFEFADVIKTGG